MTRAQAIEIVYLSTCRQLIAMGEVRSDEFKRQLAEMIIDEYAALGILRFDDVLPLTPETPARGGTD
jgi:hypothetical protein